MHIFCIEKYQEFAYFDIFLVFVEKNRKMQFLDKFDAKRILGRDFVDSHEERDQNAPFCLKTERRGQIAPFRLSTARGDQTAKYSKVSG